LNDFSEDEEDSSSNDEQELEVDKPEQQNEAKQTNEEPTEAPAAEET